MQNLGQLGSQAAQALQAHQSAKEAEQSNKTIAGSDITSLNKLLQWSTANSADPTNPPADTASEQPPKTEPTAPKTGAEKRADAEWLDAAFPDMNAGIRELVTQLEDSTLSTDDRVDVLEALQEYFLDMNYAINIHKLGALSPILQAVDSPHADVRAAAVWCVGTALQFLTEVKTLMLAHGAHKAITRRLADDVPAVRAKAVMAASAFLRHSDPDVTSAFHVVGGIAALRATLADKHVSTRRRARFFLQHAPHTGNEAFVSELLRDTAAVTAFLTSIVDVDAADVADVEAAVGSLAVLADVDEQLLLQIAPELPGVLDNLASNCTDEDTETLVRDLASRLA